MKPQRSPEWPPAVVIAIADVERLLGTDTIRDEDGEIYGWAVPTIEMIAVARIAVIRVERIVAHREDKGVLKPADLDRAARINTAYMQALDRNAMTIRGQLEAHGQALANREAAERAKPRIHVPDTPERRQRIAGILAAAGVLDIDHQEEPDGT